jgi:hypothetical protein
MPNKHGTPVIIDTRCPKHQNTHFVICAKCKTAPLSNPFSVIDRKICVSSVDIGAMAVSRSEGKQIVQIPSSLFLQERVRIRDRNGQLISGSVSYDTHAGLSLIRPGWSHLDQAGGDLLAAAIQINTVNGRGEALQLATVQIDIELGTGKGPKRTERIQCQVRDFPTKATGTELLTLMATENLSLPGGKLALPVRTEDYEDGPTICLGVPYLRLHPTALDSSSLPRWLTNRYPNLVVLRSRITGRLLFGGSMEKCLSSQIEDISHGAVVATPGKTRWGFHGGRAERRTPLGPHVTRVTLI